MGIMNGARGILIHLPTGLYARRPVNGYNIYVDGELIRYKGMIVENLTRSDAELAIAHTSYLYLRRLLGSVECHLGKRAERIVVYMDGARVANKVTDRPEFMYDASLIRSTFSAYCLDNGIEMRHLEYGESELQMYLMRDTTAELNVLVTADSDTLAIVYHHRSTPIVAETTETEIEGSIVTIGDQRIEDRNVGHAPGTVRDSCVWINCASSGIVAYGMDGLMDRLGYSPFAFRVFLALCGTDFTPQMLTESMIEGVMTAPQCDRDMANTLKDVNELAAFFVLLGLRGEGTIKRKETYDCERLDSQELVSWLDNLDALVRNYITYTETGRMDPDPVPKPKMSLLCRFYLFAMRRGADTYVRKGLQTWAKNESATQALANYREVVAQERAKLVRGSDVDAACSCPFAQSLRLAENRGSGAKRRRVIQLTMPNAPIIPPLKRNRVKAVQSPSSSNDSPECHGPSSVVARVRKAYVRERLARLRDQLNG